jgi:DNA-binding NtrC family response regulator
MVRQGKFRRDLYYRLKVVELDVPPLRARREEIPVLARVIAAQTAERHGIRFPGFSKEALDTLSVYGWPGNVRELKNLVEGIVALRPETPIRPGDFPHHILHGHAPERLLPALPADRGEADREFLIQSLLALRAEIGALRELILSRMAPVPGDARGARAPFGGVYAAGGAIYPGEPVRVEDPRVDSLSLKDVERNTVERALRESGGNRRVAARILGLSERTLYRRIKEFGLGEEAPAAK